MKTNIAECDGNYFHILLQAIPLGGNRRMKQTPGFISSNEIKLAIDNIVIAS
jgi:hypothetical protein